MIKMVSEVSEEIEPQKSRFSTKTFLSFSFYQIVWTILVTTSGLFLYKYYHTVIGLSAGWILLATTINTVWAALNDPLIGYITDRNFSWTRKWGRRFPWIVIGVIPWCFTLIVLFSAPSAQFNPWPVFWWLLLTLVVTDLFSTLSDVHAGILRADKFRTETERRKYSAMFGVFDMIALALGTVVPPLLLFGQTPEDYTLMAIIISGVALISSILFIPSAREDKIIIDRYYSGEYERMKFFAGFKQVIKQKSFIGFWLSYGLFGIATTIMTAMIVYITTYVLVTDELTMGLLMAIFLIGAMISIPIWLKIVRKTGESRKVYIIGSFIFVITLLPLSFFIPVNVDLGGLILPIDLAIFMFIAGLAIGSVWTLGIPIIFSNVQDDFTVRMGRHQKGILIGIWALLTVFINFIDELLITIVFTITQFDEGYATYEALLAALGPERVALIQWGIRLLVGLIPACVMLVGALVFWRLYPLTQAKVMENKAKLKELGL